MRLQLGPVGVDELAEGFAITGPGPGEGRFGHGRGRPFTWITPLVGTTPAAPGIHRRIAGQAGVSTSEDLTTFGSETHVTSLDRRDDVSDGETAIPGEVRRWRAFWLLAVAYFMTIIDLTIVNVALPTIGRKL